MIKKRKRKGRKEILKSKGQLRIRKYHRNNNNKKKPKQIKRLCKRWKELKNKKMQKRGWKSKTRKHNQAKSLVKTFKNHIHLISLTYLSI